MARILLIDGTVAPRNSPFLAQPAGLLSLAAVLRRDGHRVKVHDCKIEVRSLPRILAEFDPQVVGIRTMSSYVTVLERLSAIVRSAAPRTRLVVGGPHATADPGDALRRSGADAAVLGEGEATLPELVDVLCDGGDLAAVRGIARMTGDGLELTPPRPPIPDLDSLPIPAYDLIEMEPYFSLHHGGTAPSGRTLTVVTSRGCPYACAFCHNMFGRRFRARSAQAVVEEILHLAHRYRLEEIEIHDDAFNTDLHRMRKICLGLQEAGAPVSLSFPNGLRADRLPREALLDLRLAGTHHIALSPETASPRLQELLDKRMDLDRLLDAARLCDELGILTLGYFMLGFPSETEEEMRATVDWACRSPLHTASFFAVMPFPGTRIHRMAAQAGRMPPGWTGENYLEVGLNVSDVPDDRFERIWHGAYRRFYLDPRRMWKILKRVPNAPTLFRNAGFVLARALS